ncbi:MAG: hypothetical protein ACFE9Q_06560 [Candidatus Hodarchaeota archaeon]
MIFQTIGFLQALADILGALMILMEPVLTPIGQWMKDWITAVMEFLQQNFSNNFTIFIIICIIIVVSGIIVNIIWPGDIKGTIFSKGKVVDFEEKVDISEEKDIIDEIRRCKDCGNPIGDAEVCSLCGARN